MASGNPRSIRSLADLVNNRPRVARRQEGAGAQTLLRYLLTRDGLCYEDLDLMETPALTETDLAAAVLEGKADCGIAIEAVAARFRLGFIPLQQERFDLAMRRRDYFEPGIHTLLRFAGTSSFHAQAAELAGYDLSNFGRIVYNS